MWVQKWRSDHVFNAILDVVDQGGINLAIAPLMNAMMERIEEYWEELPEAWVETVALNKELSLETLRTAIVRLETAQSIFGGWVS
jgi:hypothetical protein